MIYQWSNTAGDIEHSSIRLSIFYSRAIKWKQSCLDGAVHGTWEDLSLADGETCHAALMTHQRLTTNQVIHAPYLHRHNITSNLSQSANINLITSVKQSTLIFYTGLRSKNYCCVHSRSYF